MNTRTTGPFGPIYLSQSANTRMRAASSRKGVSAISPAKAPLTDPGCLRPDWSRPSLGFQPLVACCPTIDSLKHLVQRLSARSK